MRSESSYPCITVCCPKEQLAFLCDELVALGAVALEERDETTLQLTKPGHGMLIAGFQSRVERDRALARLSQGEVAGTVVESMDVSDGKWRDGWRDYFKPVVLDRIAVITPWMDLDTTGKVAIVIDPGQAFGTGGHATTSSILKLLERRLNNQEIPERALDVGTGSGVLAIAAAKLGVTMVTAIDVDSESLSATEQNASANQVNPKLTIGGGRAKDLSGTWPLVLANLELAIFKTDAVEIAAKVGALGTLILSGLLKSQVEACLDLFPGFSVEDRIDKDGWVALQLVRGR